MRESSNKPADGPSDDPNSHAGRLMNRWTLHRTMVAGLIGVGLVGIGLASRGLSVQPPRA